MVGRILLFVILTVGDAMVQSGFLLEPQDQAVIQGLNVTFYCKVISSDVYWVVTGDVAFSSDLDPHSGPHYRVEEHVDNGFYNISLTVFTSEQVNKLTVVCHFYSAVGVNQASRTAHMFACSLPLQDPVDQEIVIGRIASFDCHTRSRLAVWMILEGNDVLPIEDLLPHTSYTVHNKSRDRSFNTTLTVTSSEDITNLSIVCSYYPKCTRTAHLLAVPCLEAVTTEHLVVNDIFYNETLNLVEVSFEVPLSCENLPINYTVFMRDSTGRIITSKGPIRYNGLQLVKEELRTTLENGHSYYVHVEAQTVGQSTVSSSNVMFRTGTPFNLKNASSWINTTTGHLSGLGKEKLTITIAVLGTLVGVLLFTTAILLGATAKRVTCRSHASGCKPRLVSTQAMVPNPIYEGPMYESIQQQFGSTTRSANVASTPQTESLQHRYVVPPSNNIFTQTPKDYENIESPSTASATPTDSDTTPLVTLAPPTGVAPPTTSMAGLAPPTTSMAGLAPPTMTGLAPPTMTGLAPPTPGMAAGLAPPTTGMAGLAPPTMTGLAPPTPGMAAGLAPTARFKERNKLQLTLALHNCKGEGFARKSSAGEMEDAIRSKAGRGTALPDLTRVMSHEDNYTFMSPPGKAPEGEEPMRAKDPPSTLQ